MQKSDQVCNQGMFHLGKSLRSEVHMAQSSTSLKLVPSGCSGVTVPVEEILWRSTAYPASRLGVSTGHRLCEEKAACVWQRGQGVLATLP